MRAIPSWARVGARVVCVDDTNWQSFDVTGRLRTPDYWGFNLPTIGEVYTIRDIDNRAGGVVVMLVEVDNRGVTPNPIEIGFALHRFKPLVTIEDDISTHFAALLDVKQPSPVSA